MTPPPILAILLCLAPLLAGGCVSTTTNSSNALAPAPPPNQTTIDFNTDPDAQQLHEDVSSALLIYVSQHDQQLPQSLDQLDLAPTQLISPGSGKPYVYYPAGLPLPDMSFRAVIFDPAPSQYGIRWGIAINDTQPRVTKVVAIPEGSIPIKSQPPSTNP